ncbi:MAG: LuxR family transcriptional regulator [Nocardioidaceae bacterium]
MGSETVGQSPPLVGRQVELARLHDLLDPRRTTGECLVVVGEAGVGKSALLDGAVETARRTGWTVLRSRGGRSETELAFAGVHQLVHGVLDRSDKLPPAQRSALHTALGLASDGDEPTPLRVGVTLARGGLPPRSLAPLPRLVLEPLGPRSSAALLDTLKMPLRGPDRQAVLSQGAGNPLALIELARAVSTSPSAALRWTVIPLPITDRLYEVYGASLAELPAPTRWALLLAAVADAGDGAVLRVATAQVPPDDWRPAEDAGLVSVDAGVRFRHPLLRAAVYRAASTSDRRYAHQVAADLLIDYPDRRAWHLAATAVSPDEEVAVHLSDSALQSSRRGAYVEASRALERAAELSADPGDRVHRLLQAADAAMRAGDSAWVREIVARVHDSTQDPALLRLSAHIEATALATTLDHASARQALRHSIRVSLPEDPLLALSSLTSAALVAQFTGEDSIRQEVVGHAAELDRSLRGHPGEALPVVSAARLWIRSAVAPVGERDALVAGLQDLLHDEVTDPDVAMMLGAAAMVLDETDTAVRLLTDAANRGRVHRPGYVSAATLTGLAWVCLDRGRWDEALTIANEGFQIAMAGRQEMHMVNADTVEATVAALRGDVRVARDRITSILATMDPDATAGIAARARQASAHAAQAAGDHALAFHELTQLFGDDGTPTHYHLSWYGLADLAASGVRSGATDRARRIIEGAMEHVSGPLRPRLRLQADRARALLAESDVAAEDFFRSAVSGSSLHVPFELAQARLDFGAWLRRRRRVIEARTMLEAAREQFERLGAAPMLERTMLELRASGIRHTERTPDLFGQLTAQQQRIARLAASGLTNREIGERLYLSPRTVSTHLYAVFPVLQITARAQLHEVVPAEGGRD